MTAVPTKPSLCRFQLPRFIVEGGGDLLISAAALIKALGYRSQIRPDLRAPSLGEMIYLASLQELED